MKLRISISLFFIVFSLVLFAQENAKEKIINKEWLRTNPDAIVYLPKG